MPQLLDLAGNAMAWATLNERNRLWHKTHDRYGSLILTAIEYEPVIPPPFYSRMPGPFPMATCYECTWGSHRRCTGGVLRPIKAECECFARGHERLA